MSIPRELGDGARKDESKEKVESGREGEGERDGEEGRKKK